MAKALGVPFGRAGRDGAGPDGLDGAWLVVGSGPGEWFVLAPARRGRGGGRLAGHDGG